MLIDRFMADPRLRQIAHVAVASAPDRAWRVARRLDLDALPLLPWLVTLRTARGMSLLAEEQGRELVLGAIGRFWRPLIDFHPVPAPEFAGFAEPGWGKLACNLRVDARAGGGSWITSDLRVDATDDAAFVRVRRTWWLVGPVWRVVRGAAMASLGQVLGGSPPRHPLAGDELIRDARYETTRREIVEAPPHEVWQRVVLAKAVPARRSLLKVLVRDADRALVLGSARLAAGAARGGFGVTRSFTVAPIGETATELLVRTRAGLVR